MKLFYFVSEHGNFGDDLNPWLWERMLPGAFDDDDSCHFIGIGTLLNHKLPQGPKVIFGSGMGYGDKPRVDDDWEVAFVRGPRTAQALGLDPGLAVTDGAVFLTQVDFPEYEKCYPLSFIPHHDSDWQGDWRRVCDAVGVHYIDPTLGPDAMFPELLKTETLICEAMHGAICADLLRVPWVPVVCYEHIFPFKWLDWSESLDMTYEPFSLSPIYDADRHFPALGRLKNGLKRGLERHGMAKPGWHPPPKRGNPRVEYQQAMERMHAVIEQGEPRLSSDTVLARRTDQAMEILQRFQRRWGL